MRVAIIVVSILVATTPSFASDSCMTKAEARQHFATSHIYWHGPDHCWDAKPVRRRSIQRNADVQVRASKWREALSELPPDVPNPPAVSNQPEPAQERSEVTNSVPTPGKAWSDRWVDVVQVVPALAAREPTSTLSASAPSSRMAIIASGVILIWLGIIVIVELVRRSAKV